VLTVDPLAEFGQARGIGAEAQQSTVGRVALPGGGGHQLPREREVAGALGGRAQKLSFRAN
jgi:hypothetical protein